MIDLTAPLARYGFEPGITHMDLCDKGRRCSDEALVTECVLIDLTADAENTGPDDVPEMDLVRRGSSVILKTGWEKHRGTSRYADSPSVQEELIRALVAKGVCLVLIDSPGVRGGEKGAEHNAMDRYLADNRAYAVENLVNLDRIPVASFRLYCFPIHLAEQNTAPCRVVADVRA